MEIRQIQLEIVEAERLIERNKIILSLHDQLVKAQEHIKELEAQHVD